MIYIAPLLKYLTLKALRYGMTDGMTKCRTNREIERLDTEVKDAYPNV